MSSSRVVRECLAALGDVDFSRCDDVESEFKAVKRAYFKRALATHPDKGGDPSEFREINASFEVLREMFNLGKISSFSDSASLGESTNFESVFSDLNDLPTPSWEYYSRAAREEVPPYRVEPAKSNRSTCQVCKKKIDAGHLRLGSMLEETGTYTRWHHLECWRVPGRVWLGLLESSNDEERTFLKGEVAKIALGRMESILLSGLSGLDSEQFDQVLEHCLDQSFHAKLTKNTVRKARADATKSAPLPQSDSKDALVPKSKPKFEIPKPGKKGAVPNALAGITIVITGVFPELGGGAGLTLGKERCKAMIESFGGRVTSAISGKTDVLVVGKDPGFSKVSQARSRPEIKLIDLGELKEVMHGLALEDTMQSLKISSFSSGYRGNSAAYNASKTELAIACGVGPTMLPEDPPLKKKPAAREKKAAAAKVKREEADVVEKKKPQRKRAAPKEQRDVPEKKTKAPRRAKNEKNPEAPTGAAATTDVVVVRSRSGRVSRPRSKYA